MPLIEVDDATHSALRDNGIKFQDRTQSLSVAQQIMERVQKMEAGPHRTEYLRVVKKQFPDLSIPELDAADPILAKFEALEKRLDDEKAEAEKRAEERAEKDRETKALDTVGKGRRYLRQSEKLDDEGVEGVEQLMRDEGIPDYEAAYLKWKRRQPAPPVDLPSNNLGRSLDWFKEEADQPDKTLLLKDPLAYRAKRRVQVLTDLRSGKIDEFGRPTANRAA